MLIKSETMNFGQAQVIQNVAHQCLGGLLRIFKQFNPDAEDHVFNEKYLLPMLSNESTKGEHYYKNKMHKAPVISEDHDPMSCIEIGCAYIVEGILENRRGRYAEAWQCIADGQFWRGAAAQCFGVHWVIQDAKNSVRTEIASNGGKNKDQLLYATPREMCKDLATALRPPVKGWPSRMEAARVIHERLCQLRAADASANYLVPKQERVYIWLAKLKNAEALFGKGSKKSRP